MTVYPEKERKRDTVHVIAIPTFQLKLPPLIAESDCPLTIADTTEKPVTVAALSARGIPTKYNLKIKL
jgi:hypothetical protein